MHNGELAKSTKFHLH